MGATFYAPVLRRTDIPWILHWIDRQTLPLSRVEKEPKDFPANTCLGRTNGFRLFRHYLQSLRCRLFASQRPEITLAAKLEMGILSIR